jgi:hypothetical protein
MSETIITPQTPSDHEYAIVAQFNELTLECLTLIQEQLNDLLGDSIWLTPERALHSTLMEIICDRHYEGLSREQHFLNWFEQYDQTVGKVIADITPFDITFNQIEVSSRAIIVRTTNSQPFNDIRAKLLSQVDLPVGTKLPPDITHCSLARFNTVLDVEEVSRLVGAIAVGFTERISHFKLLSDLGPPHFDPRTIQTYKLHSGLDTV